MSYDNLEAGKENYKSEIQYSDRILNRLIAYLKDNGLYRKSCIILTSDHGEEFLEHNFVDHGRTLYQESLHIPLIIKRPDNINGGNTVHNLYSLMDLAPEILKIAAGDRYDIRNHKFTGSPFNESSGWLWSELDRKQRIIRAIKNEKYKFIKTGNYINPNVKYELYRHDKDISEMNNLISDNNYMDIIKQLKLELRTYEKKYGAKDRYIKEDVRGRLTSLNYLY